jgi:uncharacterized protein (DUF3084 family)
MNNTELSTLTDAQMQQLFLDSQQKLSDLNRQKDRIELRYEQLTEQLTKLEEEALAKYGTKDPIELQALEQKQRLENEKNLRLFLKELQDYESLIKEANELLIIK